MPPTTAAHLVNYLFEIGPTVAVGMGEAPITHVDISAWMANTGIALEPWEARLLRRLSIEYLSASHQARKPDAPAPWAQASYVELTPRQKTQNTRNAIKALAAL